MAHPESRPHPSAHLLFREMHIASCMTQQTKIGAPDVTRFCRCEIPGGRLGQKIEYMMSHNFPATASASSQNMSTARAVSNPQPPSYRSFMGFKSMRRVHDNDSSRNSRGLAMKPSDAETPHKRVLEGPKPFRLTSPQRRPKYLSQEVDRYVSMDCEMVGVGIHGHRSVLARVTIVNFEGTCIFDTFVKVEERVTDYRFAVSGITAKDLESETAMKFGECRSKVRRIIHRKTLIGHGILNDLAVLGLTHPAENIRDTTIYEPFMCIGPYGMLRPRRLRELARDYLNIEIQAHNKPHDSLEDARATMSLYRLAKDDWESRVQMHLWSSGYLHTS